MIPLFPITQPGGNVIREKSPPLPTQQSQIVATNALTTVAELLKSV